jgi:hypothetical protein
MVTGALYRTLSALLTSILGARVVAWEMRLLGSRRRVFLVNMADDIILVISWCAISWVM